MVHSTTHYIVGSLLELCVCVTHRRRFTVSLGSSLWERGGTRRNRCWYNVVIIWTTWFLFQTLLAQTMIPHPLPCHGEDGGDEVVDVDVDVVVAGMIRPE